MTNRLKNHIKIWQFGLILNVPCWVIHGFSLPITIGSLLFLSITLELVNFDKGGSNCGTM